VVTVFTVIIAADIVAGEFSRGTIKLLLIRPASRAKILLSKYLATLGFSIVMLVFLLVAGLLFNGILYGFGDIGLPYLSFVNGNVVQNSMLAHVLQYYGLNCINLIMIVTMAFMISTVFRSSSLSIGISLAVMFLSGAVLAIFGRYHWIKYYLFANTDLSVYMNGGIPLVPGMTLGFSIVVLLVYFLIFNLLSWTLFMRRDVAA
jgi:ABC-2 type transport system permease protein